MSTFFDEVVSAAMSSGADAMRTARAERRRVGLPSQPTDLESPDAYEWTKRLRAMEAEQAARQANLVGRAALERDAAQQAAADEKIVDDWTGGSHLARVGGYVMNVLPRPPEVRAAERRIAKRDTRNAIEKAAGYSGEIMLSPVTAVKEAAAEVERAKAGLGLNAVPSGALPAPLGLAMAGPSLVGGAATGFETVTGGVATAAGAPLNFAADVLPDQNATAKEALRTGAALAPFALPLVGKFGRVVGEAAKAAERPVAPSLATRTVASEAAQGTNIAAFRAKEAAARLALDEAQRTGVRPEILENMAGAAERLAEQRRAIEVGIAKRRARLAEERGSAGRALETEARAEQVSEASAANAAVNARAEALAPLGDLRTAAEAGRRADLRIAANRVADAPVVTESGSPAALRQASALANPELASAPTRLDSFFDEVAGATEGLRGAVAATEKAARQAEQAAIAERGRETLRDQMGEALNAPAPLRDTSGLPAQRPPRPSVEWRQPGDYLPVEEPALVDANPARPTIRPSFELPSDRPAPLMDQVPPPRPSARAEQMAAVERDMARSAERTAARMEAAELAAKRAAQREVAGAPVETVKPQPVLVGQPRPPNALKEIVPAQAPPQLIGQPMVARPPGVMSALADVGRAIKSEATAPGFVPGARIGHAVGTFGREVVDAARRGAGRLGLIDNPLLEGFEVERGVNVAHLEAIRRMAAQGARDTAMERGAAILKGVPTEIAERVAEYPTLLRERGLAAAGKPTEIPLIEITKRIGDIERAIPPEVLDGFMERFRDATEEQFNTKVGLGMQSAESHVADYAPRVVAARHAGKGGAGGGGPMRVRLPGSINETVGTTKAIERNAVQALMNDIIETEGARAGLEMANEIRGRFSLNDALRDPDVGLEGLVDQDIALYKFGEKGQPGSIVQPESVKDAIRNALSAERTLQDGKRVRGFEYIERQTNAQTGKPAGGELKYATKDVAPGDALYIRDGFNVDGSPRFTQAYALPADLARGLQATGEGPRYPGLVKAMSKVNAFVRNLYLNTPVSMSYQFQQALQDPLGGAANIPPQALGTYTSALAKHARELIRETYRTLREERSPMLEQYRREGVIGGRAETYLDEQGFVSDALLPFRLRSSGQKFKTAITDGWKVPAHIVGQIREAAVKLAVRDVVMGMEVRPGVTASARRGIVYGNESLGNFWRSSPVAQALGPLTSFTKWFTNAASRITVRALEDPATGANSLRGLWSSPLPKIALKGAIVAAVNQMFGDGMQLPRSVGGRFGQGLITPFKRENGERIVIDLDGFSDVLDASVDPIVDAWHGRFEKAAKELGQRVGSRLSPLARVPLEVGTNTRFSTGAPIESDKAAKMGPAGQASRNAAAGRLPLSDKKGYAAEQLLGAPARFGRFVGGFIQGKSDDMAVPRFVGLPFQSVDPREKAREDKYRFGPESYAILADEYRKPAKERDKALLSKLWRWAAQERLAETWKRDLKAGLKAEAVEKRLTPEQKKRRALAQFPRS